MMSPGMQSSSVSSSIPTLVQERAAADPDCSNPASLAHQFRKLEHHETSSSHSGLPTLAWYLSISGFVPLPGVSLNPYSSGATWSSVFVAMVHHTLCATMVYPSGTFDHRSGALFIKNNSPADLALKTLLSMDNRADGSPGERDSAIHFFRYRPVILNNKDHSRHKTTTVIAIFILYGIHLNCLSPAAVYPSKATLECVV